MDQDMESYARRYRDSLRSWRRKQVQKSVNEQMYRAYGQIPRTIDWTAVFVSFCSLFIIGMMIIGIYKIIKIIY